MSTRHKVNQLLLALKSSFVGAEQVYTQGSCWHLYRILKTVFPQSEPYCDGGHILTKIEGRYYDINGEITDPDEIDLFDSLEDILEGEAVVELDQHPSDWKFSIYDFDYRVECPKCDHIFARSELESENITETR